MISRQGRVIEEFAIETGFTGFHFEGGGGEPGAELLSSRHPTPISVALRGPDQKRFVFYTERTERIWMDLSDAPSGLSAIAVDTRRPYNEIDLGTLKPKKQSWQAPRRSDWAIAVGTFNQGSNR